MGAQQEFVFPVRSAKPRQLVTPDEIYANATQDLLGKFVEDRRYERKPAGIKPLVLQRWFSMFANTIPDGGVIAVGIADDGTPEGCSHLSDSQLNELEKIRRLIPDAHHQSKRIPINTTHGENFILLFRVRYNETVLVETTDCEAYIRSGDECHKLTDEEKQEVAADKGQVQTELQSVNGYTFPADFDEKQIKAFADRYRDEREIDPARLTDENVLRLRHLGKITQKGFEPNLACVLLFAYDPMLVVPGCKLQFIRYEGQERETGIRQNVIKQQWFEGNVPRVIADSARFLDSQIRDFYKLGKDDKFQSAPEYPREAWHEAIVNACAHRSYGLKTMSTFVRMFDDRLEIQSPGGFPPFVNPENIYDNSTPRNRNLMDALYYLDFVQCANEGTKRMRDAMHLAGLPAPIFEQKQINYAQVRVTLKNDVTHRRAYVIRDVAAIIGDDLAKTLDETDKRIVNYVYEYGRINVTEARNQGLKDWHTARNRLLKLQERKILIRVARQDIKKDPKAYFILANPPSRKSETHS